MESPEHAAQKPTRIRGVSLQEAVELRFTELIQIQQKPAFNKRDSFKSAQAGQFLVQYVRCILNFVGTSFEIFPL